MIHHTQLDARTTEYLRRLRSDADAHRSLQPDQPRSPVPLTALFARLRRGLSAKGRKPATATL